MTLNHQFKRTQSSGAHEQRPAEGSSEEHSAALKKRYLLRRFWQSAAGFWARRGNRSSWLLAGVLLLISLLNLATSYGMNVWNRGMFDALEKSDSPTVLLLSIAYFALLGISVLLRLVGVCAYDGATALARLVEQAFDRPVAGEGPLLSTQPSGGRPQEPGISHCRRYKDCDGIPGRVRDWNYGCAALRKRTMCA
jgi:hypothetical protein